LPAGLNFLRSGGLRIAVAGGLDLLGNRHDIAPTLRVIFERRKGAHIDV
jgi:hypothetical protein